MPSQDNAELEMFLFTVISEPWSLDTIIYDMFEALEPNISSFLLSSLSLCFVMRLEPGSPTYRYLQYLSSLRAQTMLICNTFVAREPKSPYLHNVWILGAQDRPEPGRWAERG